MSPRLDRRSFLRSSLGTLAALPFVSVSVTGCGTDPGKKIVTDDRAAIALERALALLPAGPATRLGNRYLNDVVPSHDPDEVAVQLEPILVILGEPESDDEAFDALAERIHKDFLEDVVHDLEGWTLSVSELQVCMLIAVMDG